MLIQIKLKMKNLHYILFFLSVTNIYCQTTISKEKAIEIAIVNRIQEPLDSFNATLKDDTLWFVESLNCDDGGYSQTMKINAQTGEYYKEIMGTFYCESWHSHPTPKTRMTRYIDSLLPLNLSGSIQLLPDFADKFSDPIFSPDSKWIAFGYGNKSIAITSLDGREYHKVCDNCLYPNWTEKPNTLVYEKDYRAINEYNAVTNETKVLIDDGCRLSDFMYCPAGEWVSYIKPVQRISDDPNVVYASFEGGDYQLFVRSLITGKEKQVTSEGNVNRPVWKLAGDTIFFYIQSQAYFATNFNAPQSEYGITKYLDSYNINDYAHAVNNQFLVKHDCQLFLVNSLTRKPIKYILKKPGRYSDYSISGDGKYVVYILEKNRKSQMHLIKNN